MDGWMDGWMDSMAGFLGQLSWSIRRVRLYLVHKCIRDLQYITKKTPIRNQTSVVDTF